MNKIILKELDKYLGGMVDVNKAPIPIKKTYLLEHVNREDMTYDTVKAIRIVAINPRDMYLYGSYTYKAQPYPGDIDAFEKIQLCEKGCTRDEAVHKIVKLIQDMIRKALEVPGVYLGDVKICVNNQVWNFLKNGWWGDLSSYDNNKDDNPLEKKKFYGKSLFHIYDVSEDEEYHKIYPNEPAWVEPKNPSHENNNYVWDSKKCMKDLNDMKRLNLITPQSYKDIKKYIKPKISVSNWIELKDVLREILILRWSKEEIYQGYKILVGGRKLFLDQAIKNCNREYDASNQKVVSAGLSMIKPDFWLKVNDKYLEMSDLLLFSFINQDKQSENISDYTFLEPGDTEKDLRDNIIKTLKTDLAKYYYSPLKKHANPLKYAKRLFSLALLHKDVKTANKLAYLWKSELNLMSQLKAEIDVIINMLEKVKEPPLRDLKHQVDQMKFRLSHIIDSNIPPWIIKNINTVANPKTPIPEMIKLLEPIYDHLKEEINKGTLQYLKKADLWPASDKYLAPKNYTINI